MSSNDVNLFFYLILISDLSLQAATKALSAPPEEALNILKTISQNFPVQARLENKHITDLFIPLIVKSSIQWFVLFSTNVSSSLKKKKKVIF